MSDTHPVTDTTHPARLVWCDPYSNAVAGPIEAVTAEAEAAWRAKGYIDAPEPEPEPEPEVDETPEPETPTDAPADKPAPKKTTGRKTRTPAPDKKD